MTKLDYNEGNAAGRVRGAGHWGIPYFKRGKSKRDCEGKDSETGIRGEINEKLKAKADARKKLLLKLMLPIAQV